MSSLNRAQLIGHLGRDNGARFWSHVERSESPGACWEWLGCKQSNGYGRVRVRSVTLYAHRAAYLLFIGEIAAGMDVCHRCDNRRCVRPDHLFLGTRLTNMQDARRKGRLSVGESHRRAVLSGRKTKLTVEQVREIDLRLSAGGESMAAIARDFQVNPTNVRLIGSGAIWSHVTGRGRPSRPDSSISR